MRKRGSYELAARQLQVKPLRDVAYSEHTFERSPSAIQHWMATRSVGAYPQAGPLEVGIGPAGRYDQAIRFRIRSSVRWTRATSPRAKPRRRRSGGYPAGMGGRVDR